MTIEHKHCAMARISFEKMGELLDLPEGHRVIDVCVGRIDRKCQSFDVLVCGGLLPAVPEGFEAPRINLFRGRNFIEEFQK